jgi:hypothetical protein
MAAVCAALEPERKAVEKEVRPITRPIRLEFSAPFFED